MIKGLENSGRSRIGGVVIASLSELNA